MMIIKNHQIHKQASFAYIQTTYIASNQQVVIKLTQVQNVCITYKHVHQSYDDETSADGMQSDTCLYTHKLSQTSCLSPSPSRKKLCHRNTFKHTKFQKTKKPKTETKISTVGQQKLL